MFDEPLQRGSRLPETPRINSLLAGLMGTSPAPAAPLAPAPVPTPLAPLFGETASAPRTIQAKTVSTFLKSIQWSYSPSDSPRIVITPGIAVREFFALVNWSGDLTGSSASPGSSIAPPSVENLMSQFSWD